MTTVFTVDPTDLKPGDLVIKINDRDLDGCHCDVMVTVFRSEEENAQSASQPE